MENMMPIEKMNARVIGVLFLAAIVAYATGNTMVDFVLNAEDYLSRISTSRTQLVVGALLMLSNSAVVLSIGILMLPILRRHSVSIAYGYFSSRLVECIVLALGVISILTFLPIAAEYQIAGNDPRHFLVLGAIVRKANYFAYQVAMVALGSGSVLLCYLLYQAKLLPRILSAWGMIGYGLLLAGAVLELFGFSVGLILSIPGGLFELFLAAWLIVKGFNLEVAGTGHNNGNNNAPFVDT